MQCPECHQQLVVDETTPDGAPRLARCPACQGCWLDQHGIEAWPDLEDLPVTEASALGQLACPSCGVRLVEVFPADHRNLTVDKCPACHGFWLDKGELRSLREVALEESQKHTQRESESGWAAFKRIAYLIEDQLKYVASD